MNQTSVFWLSDQPLLTGIVLAAGVLMPCSAARHTVNREEAISVHDLLKLVEPAW